MASIQGSSSLQQTASDQSTVCQAHCSQDLARSNTLSLALQNLGGKIGYRNISIYDSRSQRLVLADTITHIELLQSGRKITKRPREMREMDVRSQLKCMIPKAVFIAIGVAQENAGSARWQAPTRELMVAANEYIRMLEEGGKTLVRNSNPPLVIRPRNKQPVGEVTVEEALEKIENWADGWLRGEVLEWHSFEDCLKK